MVPGIRVLTTAIVPPYLCADFTGGQLNCARRDDLGDIYFGRDRFGVPCDFRFWQS